MKRSILLKTLLVVLLSIVVNSVGYGAIRVLWPPWATVSVDKVAYPAATLLTTIVFLVWVKIIWRKSDGAYVNTSIVRWTFVVLLLFELAVTAVVTIIVIQGV